MDNLFAGCPIGRITTVTVIAFTRRRLTIVHQPFDHPNQTHLVRLTKIRAGWLIIKVRSKGNGIVIRIFTHQNQRHISQDRATIILFAYRHGIRIGFVAI